MQRLADQYVDGCRRLRRHCQNLGMFVVMAEVMALCAVFLTTTAKRANCGLRWGVLALCCCDCLLAAVAALRHAGSAPAGMRMQQLPLGSDIWLLGVIGLACWPGLFRCTAGCRRHMLTLCASCRVVFYGSHENWPAGHLTLSLLGGNAPLWWGIVLLVLV